VSVSLAVAASGSKPLLGEERTWREVAGQARVWPDPDQDLERRWVRFPEYGGPADHALPAAPVEED